MRVWLRAHRWDLLIVAGYLLLPLLLYAGVTFGPNTMLPADNLYQWAPWSAAAVEFGATPPHNALISDLVIQNLVWKQFVLDSLAQGEIPLWNPNQFAGVPFLAAGQHSALYPFSLLFLILPLTKAYGWFALSQLWLAGALMYVLGRVLGMRRGGAAIAGLVYQGGGFIVTSAAVFPMIVAAVAWLPLLLACIERIIELSGRPEGVRGRIVWWVALGAGALGLQTLAGHAEFTYYTLLIMALYAAWRLATVAWSGRRSTDGEKVGSWLERLGRPAVWLAAMVGLGLMLAAVQLIPLYEVGQVNFREGSATFSEVLGWAYPWRDLVSLAMPNFYGNPTHHAYFDLFTRQQVPFELNHFGELNPNGAFTSSWGIKNFVEGAYYLGILPLLLAAVAALGLVCWRVISAARRAHTLFFLGLSAFSVAFIFGTPLYAILFYGLPFINQLHTPFRWVFPLSLAVAALAGFGVDAIERVERPQPEAVVCQRMRTLVTVVSVLALVAGVVVLAGLLTSWLFYDQLTPFIERLFLGLAKATEAFPTTEAFYSYQVRQAAVLGLLLVGSGVVLWLRRRRWWVGVAAALIVADLLVASAGFNAAVDPALLAHKPQVIAWLQAQPDPGRLTTFDPTGANVLNANTPGLFGLSDVRGYDSIIPRQYTDFMAAIEPQNGLQFNRVQSIGNLDSLNSPLLDILGVRYIASMETLDLPKLQEVWSGEGIRIYENLAVAPRAYVLPQSATVVAADPLEAMQTWDPRSYVVVGEGDVPDGAELPAGGPTGGTLQAATLDSASNLELVVSTAVDQPSWLILNDSYAPGWRAFVRPAGGGESEETEAAITLVNGNFRGVLLEPGEWSVRFRYSPRSFQLGGLASFMAGIILVFMLGVWGWRRFYRAEAMSSTTRSVAKNSAAPMFLNLFNKGIDFVFAAYYLRLLGPANAGSFATAIAVAGIFEILANYGLNILLMREISQDRSQAGRFLFNSSILRIGIGLVSAIPIAIYIWASSGSVNPLSTAEIVAIVLMMIGMIFSGLSLGVSGLFYVHEQAEIPAAMATVTTILKVGFGVAVLSLGFSFVGLAAVSILVNLITLVTLSVLAFSRFAITGPYTLDTNMQRSMLRLGFPLMLIHLLQTVFISVDVLILRQRLVNGEEVVGWYNSAYKWFNALQIIPSYFTLALFPIISRAIKENKESARRMYQMSLKLMLLLALPIAALTTFSADILIGLLGGREFLPDGAIALQIIIWSIPFGWLNSVTNYVLIALGLEGMQPRAFALAVGFNIIANWLLIPRYSYVAAGVTTILSEVLLLILFDRFLRQRMEGVDWVRFAWRPVALTAVMVAVMWVISQYSTILALGAGALIYVVGLAALKIIGPDEKRALANVLPVSLASRLGLVS